MWKIVGALKASVLYIYIDDMISSKPTLFILLFYFTIYSTSQFLFLYTTH